MPQRRSKNHKIVLKTLETLFPGAKVEEEHAVRIENHVLFLDIYLPYQALALEIHGAQHYKYNRFMHGNPFKFSRQVKHDDLKHRYCQEQGIMLVELDGRKPLTAEVVQQKIEETYNGSDTIT